MPSPPNTADNEWLIGLRAIAKFMGRHDRTIRRWIDDHGFPAGMLPSGHWIASKQSIRDWIIVRGRQIVDKRRNTPGEVAEMTVIGDVSGRKCIIVDDICDTAGTLCKAADTLIEKGATEVHSYITHGVLSGPAVERITNSTMKQLVITDSIEATPEVAACDKIRIVPTAPLLAQATLNIANGTSVSSLFDEGTLEPIYEGYYKGH